MSRRSVGAAKPAGDNSELPSIEHHALAAVSGGLIGPRTTLDPALLEGIQELSKAIESAGQSLAAARENSTQQLMQMMQQIMRARSGE